MRFSVIMVHHQGTTTHAEFCHAVAGIKAQTFADYELLAYHNGPLTDPDVTLPCPVQCSEANTGFWGIDNRNWGLHEAQGEYILHTNSDNVHYPTLLEEVDKAIDRPARIVQDGHVVDTDNIIIYPIVLHDHQRVFDHAVRFSKGSGHNIILTGNPPAPCNIDGMQWVMKRELWIKHGGWYDRSPVCDGLMAQQFARAYGYRTIDKVLGEHA